MQRETGGATNNERPAEKTNLVSSSADGDWSYLRTHLDHPRHWFGGRFGEALAAWILHRWHTAAARPAQLHLLSRIQLAPRQTVALLEADGVRLLVATSADGAASFFPLHSRQAVTSPESALDVSLLAAQWEASHSWPSDRMQLPFGFGRSARRSRLPNRVSW